MLFSNEISALGSGIGPEIENRADVDQKEKDDARADGDERAGRDDGRRA